MPRSNTPIAASFIRVFIWPGGGYCIWDFANPARAA
jgi:hypothetical protein